MKEHLGNKPVTMPSKLLQDFTPKNPTKLSLIEKSFGSRKLQTKQTKNEGFGQKMKHIKLFATITAEPYKWTTKIISQS